MADKPRPQIYLLGNVVVWWFAAGTVLVYLILEIGFAVGRQRGPGMSFRAEAGGEDAHGRSALSRQRRDIGHRPRSLGINRKQAFHRMRYRQHKAVGATRTGDQKAERHAV